jgi:hypothetical protein
LNQHLIIEQQDLFGEKVECQRKHKILNLDLRLCVCFMRFIVKLQPLEFSQDSRILNYEDKLEGFILIWCATRLRN